MFLVHMFSPTRANFQNVFTVMITTSKRRTRAWEGIAAIFLINNHYCQWKNDLRPPHHTHTHIKFAIYKVFHSISSIRNSYYHFISQIYFRKEYSRDKTKLHSFITYISNLQQHGCVFPHR